MTFHHFIETNETNSHYFHKYHYFHIDLALLPSLSSFFALGLQNSLLTQKSLLSYCFRFSPFKTHYLDQNHYFHSHCLLSLPWPFKSHYFHKYHYFCIIIGLQPSKVTTLAKITTFIHIVFCLCPGPSKVTTFTNITTFVLS